MSPSQWIEAEELYRSGWTQSQIADKYGVRVETVSRHMTKRKVSGGERAETVREELAAAIAKKQRDFAESKAQRQIDAKELLFKMTNVLVGAFAKEFQQNLAAARPLAALSGSAKALKDAVLAMKVSREELYTVLDIKDDDLGDQLPDLVVSSMTEDEETALRSRVEPDADDDDLAQQMEGVLQTIEHQVDAKHGNH